MKGFDVISTGWRRPRRRLAFLADIKWLLHGLRLSNLPLAVILILLLTALHDFIFGI